MGLLKLFSSKPRDRTLSNNVGQTTSTSSPATSSFSITDPPPLTPVGQDRSRTTSFQQRNEKPFPLGKNLSAKNSKKSGKENAGSGFRAVSYASVRAGEKPFEVGGIEGSPSSSFIRQGSGSSADGYGNGNGNPNESGRGLPLSLSRNFPSQDALSSQLEPQPQRRERSLPQNQYQQGGGDGYRIPSLHLGDSNGRLSMWSNASSASREDLSLQAGSNHPLPPIPPSKEEWLKPTMQNNTNPYPSPSALRQDSYHSSSPIKSSFVSPTSTSLAPTPSLNTETSFGDSSFTSSPQTRVESPLSITPTASTSVSPAAITPTEPTGSSFARMRRPSPSDSSKTSGAKQRTSLFGMRGMSGNSKMDGKTKSKSTTPGSELASTLNAEPDTEELARLYSLSPPPSKLGLFDGSGSKSDSETPDLHVADIVEPVRSTRKFHIRSSSSSSLPASGLAGNLIPGGGGGFPWLAASSNKSKTSVVSSQDEPSPSAQMGGAPLAPVTSAQSTLGNSSSTLSFSGLLLKGKSKSRDREKDRGQDYPVMEGDDPSFQLRGFRHISGGDGSPPPWATYKPNELSKVDIDAMRPQSELGHGQKSGALLRTPSENALRSVSGATLTPASPNGTSSTLTVRRPALGSRPSSIISNPDDPSKQVSVAMFKQGRRVSAQMVLSLEEQPREREKSDGSEETAKSPKEVPLTPRKASPGFGDAIEMLVSPVKGLESHEFGYIAKQNDVGPSAPTYKKKISPGPLPRSYSTSTVETLTREGSGTLKGKNSTSNRTIRGPSPNDFRSDRNKGFVVSSRRFSVSSEYDLPIRDRLGALADDSVSQMPFPPTIMEGEPTGAASTARTRSPPTAQLLPRPASAMHFVEAPTPLPIPEPVSYPQPNMTPYAKKSALLGELPRPPSPLDPNTFRKAAGSRSEPGSPQAIRMPLQVPQERVARLPLTARLAKVSSIVSSGSEPPISPLSDKTVNAAEVTLEKERLAREVPLKAYQPLNPPVSPTAKSVEQRPASPIRPTRQRTGSAMSTASSTRPKTTWDLSSDEEDSEPLKPPVLRQSNSAAKLRTGSMPSGIRRPPPPSVAFADPPSAVGYIPLKKPAEMPPRRASDSATMLLNKPKIVAPAGKRGMPVVSSSSESSSEGESSSEDESLAVIKKKSSIQSMQSANIESAPTVPRSRQSSIDSTTSLKSGQPRFNSSDHSIPNAPSKLRQSISALNNTSTGQERERPVPHSRSSTSALSSNLHPLPLPPLSTARPIANTYSRARSHYSPASSQSGTGDTSSSGMPVTPMDINSSSSDLASAIGMRTPSSERSAFTRPSDGRSRRTNLTHDDLGATEVDEATKEKRRNERRRDEAKAAMNLGNAVNGPTPLPSLDSNDSQTGMPYNPYFGNPQLQAQQQQQMYAMQMAQMNPAFMQMHQQAMMFAQHQYQAALAAAAMQASNDDWERGSNATGFTQNQGGFNPGQMPPMMMFPGMGGFSMGGSVYGGGGSVYGGSIAGGGGGSVYGGTGSVYGESFGPPVHANQGSSQNHQPRSNFPRPNSGSRLAEMNAGPEKGNPRPSAPGGRARTQSGYGSPLKETRRRESFSKGGSNEGEGEWDQPPNSWKTRKN